MSQPRNRGAEKLCQGHRGPWLREARGAVPAGSRGGGRQGRGPHSSQDPRGSSELEGGLASDRAVAKGVQEVTHLGRKLS